VLTTPAWAHGQPGPHGTCVKTGRQTDSDHEKVRSVFTEEYDGDLFGSRGDNTNGMLFLSRIAPDPFATEDRSTTSMQHERR
jgi:hypothetical protein